MRYIAFLRGINVGGHQVKMAALREEFASLGYTNVASYIQSGNLFFDSAVQDRAVLRQQIETQLQATLGYAVPTCLRTTDELTTLLARDPFAGIELTPDRRFSVTFLSEPVATDPDLPYTTPKGDYTVVGMTPQELFVVWQLQDGRPGSGFTQLDRRYGVPNTTRFWHTTAKILAAATKEH